MKFFRFVLPLFAGAIMGACGNTSNIGGSILTDEIVVVMDSSFVASGFSVPESRVQSRTTVQLLGIVEAKEYGNFSSEFVTQFMPAGEIDTVGVPLENIDSLQLIFIVPNGAIVGDSIVPMGLNVYPLDKQLPSPIYSDFDATGYYNPNDLYASRIYACNALNESDSVASLDYRYLFVKMPNELAKKLYGAYLENPSVYLSPSEFTKVFPGIYVSNSYGSGRVMKIGTSIMRLHFRRNGVSASTGNDTIYNEFGNFYAVTPEIITNNNIKYQMSENLEALIGEGRNIISAPTGSEVELIFPAQEIIDTYREGSGTLSVVNTLSMSIPAKEISNEYNINPPENLLLILKSKKEEFFLQNNLNDDETSFYATYDSKNKRYDFSSMRDYLLMLLEKETLTPEDYTFVLTPITLNYETNNSSYYYQSTYVESIQPYVEQPAMVELDVKKSKIILTFTRQSTKN